MTNALLQIVVIICFIVLVIVLFFEKLDYLIYSIAIIVVAGLFTAIFIPEAQDLENYFTAIEWEIVFFLIIFFCIVEILNETGFFQELARRLVNRYKSNLRKLFYIICIISTLTAAFIEDLSVAIIFVPIIILACQELEINSTPFLLGMTICINLASTLTPFGSAQNILIANHFNLSTLWFIVNLGPFFVISTFLTLFFLDQFVLTKEIKHPTPGMCEDIEGKEVLQQIKVEDKVFKKNFYGFIILIILLIIIPSILIAGLIGLVIFVLLNPVKDKKGKSRPNVSHYLRKVDYKLIFFFICLFILVYLMELNGTIIFIEDFFVQISTDNLFLLCLMILIITSVLSGFIDNTPVTIMFIPIVEILIGIEGVNSIPLLIAFITGINIGGNFLPQGSACDMMTLELATKECVPGLNYKKLTKIGGTFAVIHVLLAIGYIIIIIFLFP